MPRSIGRHGRRHLRDPPIRLFVGQQQQLLYNTTTPSPITENHLFFLNTKSISQRLDNLQKCTSITEKCQKKKQLYLSYLIYLYIARHNILNKRCVKRIFKGTSETLWCCLSTWKPREILARYPFPPTLCVYISKDKITIISWDMSLVI